MTQDMLMERHPVFSEDEILDSVTPRLIEHFFHMRGEERPDSTALPSTSRHWQYSFDGSSGRTTSDSSRNVWSQRSRWTIGIQSSSQKFYDEKYLKSVMEISVSLKISMYVYNGVL